MPTVPFTSTFKSSLKLLPWLSRAYSLISDMFTGLSALSIAVPGETIKSATPPVSSSSSGSRQQHNDQSRPFVTAQIATLVSDIHAHLSATSDNQREVACTDP